MVLNRKKYLALFLFFSLFFWIVFGFLLGLEQLPWLDWPKLQESVLWEVFLPNLFFILAAGLLNALLLSLTIFRLKELSPKLGNETKAGALGLGLSTVFAACPFCAISLASVLGVSIVSSFIAPYYSAFQMLALLVVLVSLYWTSQQIGTECVQCQIKI